MSGCKRCQIQIPSSCSVLHPWHRPFCARRLHLCMCSEIFSAAAGTSQRCAVAQNNHIVTSSLSRVFVVSRSITRNLRNPSPPYSVWRTSNLSACLHTDKPRSCKVRCSNACHRYLKQCVLSQTLCTTGEAAFIRVDCYGAHFAANTTRLVRICFEVCIHSWQPQAQQCDNRAVCKTVTPRRHIYIHHLRRGSTVQMQVSQCNSLPDTRKTLRSACGLSCMPEYLMA